MVIRIAGTRFGAVVRGWGCCGEIMRIIDLVRERRVELDWDEQSSSGTGGDALECGCACTGDRYLRFAGQRGRGSGRRGFRLGEA
jgi:hypothetical protein